MGLELSTQHGAMKHHIVRLPKRVRRLKSKESNHVQMSLQLPFATKYSSTTIGEYKLWLGRPEPIIIFLHVSQRLKPQPLHDHIGTCSSHAQAWLLWS
eukprot:2761371-Amphidinium_carterae.1